MYSAITAAIVPMEVRRPACGKTENETRRLKIKIGTGGGPDSVAYSRLSITLLADEIRYTKSLGD